MISRRTEAYAAHYLALLQQALEDQNHNDVKVLEETKRMNRQTLKVRETLNCLR